MWGGGREHEKWWREGEDEFGRLKVMKGMSKGVFGFSFMWV